FRLIGEIRSERQAKPESRRMLTVVGDPEIFTEVVTKLPQDPQLERALRRLRELPATAVIGLPRTSRRLCDEVADRSALVEVGIRRGRSSRAINRALI